MRAWTITKRGPPRESLKFHTSFPTPPSPTGSQLLIKVAYVSVNPSDLALINLIPNFLRPKNSIPCIDISGTIIAVGPQVHHNGSKPYPVFKVGDRVFGTPSFGDVARGHGTLAECILVDARGAKLRVCPKNLSLIEAGGFGVTGFTGIEIADRVKIRGGERVLINGASGGCGTFEVQILKGMGVGEVVGVCSERSGKLVRELGADKVIDYKVHNPLHKFLEQEYSNNPFDIIIDNRGNQELYTHSPAYLKKSGRFVNIGQYTHGIVRTLFNIVINLFWPAFLGGTPRKYIWFSQNATAPQLDLLVSLTEEGKVRSVVDKVFEMEEALEAFDYLASKVATGKVMVKVGGDDGV